MDQKSPSTKGSVFVQHLNMSIRTIRARPENLLNLIAWLGNASNGIGEFFAQVGNFQTDQRDDHQHPNPQRQHRLRREVRRLSSVHNRRPTRRPAGRPGHQQQRQQPVPFRGSTEPRGRAQTLQNP